MCGIAGVVYSDRSRIPEEATLRRMAKAIEHRGPDGQGIWGGSQCGLAHRRLSIIDLGGGKQPLSNEDGSVQLVFNGEIYNYQELRRELIQKGHRFKTESDSEVIVHLYEDHGPHFVNRLRGMFAIAIWDSRSRRLVLTRDRVGIKPLYFHHTADRLLFGSELKAILAHGDVPRELDPLALDEYLRYGMVPGRRCIFKGLKKLLPGEQLILNGADWSESRHRYWQLEFRPDDSLTVDEWKHRLMEKLDESVRLHMVADVPVGSFLSGGLDSSVITGLAMDHVSTPIQTFSMGFVESKFNELPAAREISRHFGTDHREEVVSPDAVALLPQLAKFYDEPFADSSAIPTFLVSQIASRDVKVVLSGDGGDEALGGYSRYAHDLREARLRSILPSWLRSPWLAMLSKLWPQADWLPRPFRLKTCLTNLSRTPANAYANTLSLCRQPLRRRLLNNDVVRHLDGNGHLANKYGFGDAHSDAVVEAGFRNAADAKGNIDPLSGMIAADMATLLPDDYLVKVDRASMANGLEVRPPMLDHEFLELCSTIPSQMKIRAGETKFLLREAAKNVLPASILKRPKQGFEIPIDGWFRGPLREVFEGHVLESNATISPWIDQREARNLLDSHVAGRSRQGSNLWSLLALAMWADRFLSESISPAEAAAHEFDTSTRATSVSTTEFADREAVA